MEKLKTFVVVHQVQIIAVLALSVLALGYKAFIHKGR
jgi:hypothetical protein